MQTFPTFNSDVIQDLKDFIEATVSGQLTSRFKAFEESLEQRLDKKLDEKLTEKLAPIESKIDGLEAKIDEIEVKIDELSSDVALAISTSNESTDSRLNNHEKRITRLELRAA